MEKKLKVLVLFDTAGEPPKDQDFSGDLKTEDWKTERHVLNALKKLGHEVEHVGIFSDLEPLVSALKEFKPDIVFNLVEHFGGKRSHDMNVAGFLDLMGVPYTGSGPAGMLLCRNKDLSKIILTHHRILNPRFTKFLRGKMANKPKHLPYPLFVKPVSEDASQGISQASFIEDDAALKERVKFIHETINDDALAEEYIQGRELYASILGNDRLTIFPLREISFEKMSDDDPKIATYKAKWNMEYRKRWGIVNRFATDIPDDLLKRIEDICKKTYRLLNIRGWGRIDLKLTPKNEIVILEANPNPFLAAGEDFALSAKKAEIPYEDLIEKIVALGLKK